MPGWFPNSREPFVVCRVREDTAGSERALMGRIHLDYYTTLAVTPQASDDEIKRAYRKLALKYHPDRNQGNAGAEEKIREINAAYEVLGDPETRQSYERLRFGGYGRKTDFADETPADTLSPDVILESMEKKLWEEGRVEIFRQLLRDLPLVKRELANIRKATVAALGYDKFREEIVKRHAGLVMGDLVTPDMEERKARLLDIAGQMMRSQGVGGGREEGTDWVDRQLAAAFHRGRVHGYCQACELRYVRR